MNVKVKGVYRNSYLNIISVLVKKLDLPHLIDHLVPVDPQCQTRVSDAVQAILYNLFDGRQALVHLERWAQEIDLEKLIRPSLQPSWLNDDALARHLDRLYEADIHKVISTCLIHIYRKEGLSLRAFHADTTDKTVYGAYESASLEALQITHGYNRHQHWQKQIGFGLVGNEDGIPFYGDVHDGNRSDKAWNPEVLSRIHEQFKQAKIDDEWIYVADSAAMTKDTLAQAKAANAFLVTRGPSSLRIVKRALAEADSPHIPWSEPFTLAERNGATYRVWETAATYEGHPVRLIVVESSALDQRKGKTLEKERAKEAELLHEEQVRWERHPFSCLEDAEQALTSLKTSLRPRFHRAKAAVEEIVRTKKRRGRPKKGAEPETETLYTLRLNIEFNQPAWEQARRKASRFVLVTTVPKEWKGQQMDAQEILKLYKGQISVEMNFAFLKDPFFTDEIYVKKPERVAVLGYLFLLALAIYRVFQRRVRQFITPERPLKGAGGRKLTRPTGQAIFQLFQYVNVILLELPDGRIQRALDRSLNPDQRRILQGLGMDESIYV
ncbi:IS1634 family transposase [Caldibacillus thermoamylovorans]